MKETHTMPDGTVMPGASHSPNKMIGGIAGAMAQQPGAIDAANQMQQSPVNPVALGGMQSKMPNMFGQPQPRVSYNNLMPDPSAPLNQNRVMQTRTTFGMLNAKNSKEAAAAEAKRKEAQRLAKEKKDMKGKDPVSGKTMIASAPAKTYSESSSKIIYNEDGSVSRKQTIK